MIPNHYIKHSCFTKHPLKMVVCGYQEVLVIPTAGPSLARLRMIDMGFLANPKEVVDKRFCQQFHCRCENTNPGSPRPKQRMVFRMIHKKDSLLPMGKVWSLDFLGKLFEMFIQLDLAILRNSVGNNSLTSQWTHWGSFLVEQKQPRLKHKSTWIVIVTFHPEEYEQSQHFLHSWHQQP